VQLEPKKMSNSTVDPYDFTEDIDEEPRDLSEDEFSPQRPAPDMSFSPLTSPSPYFETGSQPTETPESLNNGFLHSPMPTPTPPPRAGSRGSILQLRERKIELIFYYSGLKIS
jgi:hypothetical protein